MNLGLVYDIILAILKKESRGNLLKPNQFTDFLVDAHTKYYNQQFAKWGSDQAAQDSLRPFQITDQAVTFAGTSVALSTLRTSIGDGHYRHLIGARYSTGDNVCRVLTSKQWNEFAGDSVQLGSSTWPVVMVDGTNLNTAPSLSGVMKVSYLIDLEQDISPYDSSDNVATGTANSDVANHLVDSTASFTETVSVGMVVRNTTDGTEAKVTVLNDDDNLTLSSDIFPDGNENYIIYDHLMKGTKYYLPFFDYYTDAYKHVQYLYNGQSYTLGASEVYRDGTASGAVTGVSHELKWGNQDIVNIISLILQNLGVSLSSPDITQFAMAEQQQENAVS